MALVMVALVMVALVHVIALPSTRLLTVLLVRAKPAHIFYWVAFSLLAIGFLLDLLAS